MAAKKRKQKIRTPKRKKRVAKSKRGQKRVRPVPSRKTRELKPKSKSKQKSKSEQRVNASPQGQQSRPQTSGGGRKGKLIGRVAHYYDRIGVIALKLEDSLKKGDSIRIEGGQTSFTQQVESMQIERQDVAEGKRGDEVGIKIDQKAREGYRVFKI